MSQNSLIESRIKSLLSSGVSAARAAELVGCSPGVVSQLMAREDFAADVQAALDRDNRLNGIEDRLITVVDKAISSPLVFLGKPMEAIRALQLVNGLKRRSLGEAMQTPGEVRQVSLIMPVNIINKFTVSTDEHNKITQVNDIELVTASQSQLASLATIHKEENKLCTLQQSNKAIKELTVEDLA